MARFKFSFNVRGIGRLTGFPGKSAEQNGLAKAQK